MDKLHLKERGLKMMSVNSSAMVKSPAISTAISANCITMTFCPEMYAPKEDLLVNGVEKKITEKHLDVEFDATSLGRGILTIVVEAASAVGYAVAELIDYIIKRIKASRY